MSKETTIIPENNQDQEENEATSEPPNYANSTTIRTHYKKSSQEILKHL